MRNCAISYALTAALLLAAHMVNPSPAGAHGVALSRINGNAIVIEGQYSDGEAMSFSQVVVRGPDGKTHQKGRSDRQGRFAFFPSRPGEWKIVFSDGQGHRAESVIKAGEAAQAAAPPAEPASAAPDSKLGKALMGASLIFGLFGVISLWRSRARKS